MSAYLNLKRSFRRRLLRVLQPCQDMVVLMSDALERPLDLLERIKLKLHLLICAWCARYFQQIKMIRSLLGLRADECDFGEGLSVEARERIKRALREKP